MYFARKSRVDCMRHVRILSLHIQQVLHYKLRSFVWMLVSSVSAAILLMFWSAKISSNPDIYTLQDLGKYVSYYLILLVAGNVLISHSEGEIASIDVYKGELANYLLKPYSYLLYKLYGEVVWRGLSGFWALCIVGIMFFLGIRLQITTNIFLFILFLVSCVVAFAVSFVYTVILGLSALWLTTTKGIFELHEMAILLLAGFMVPLSSMPAPLSRVLYWTPFASMLAIPVRIIAGELHISQALFFVAIQIFWLFLLYFLYRITWHFGVRKFCGVGQ